MFIELTTGIESLIHASGERGSFSGAVCLVARDGEIVAEVLYGVQALWRDDLEEIPSAEREAVTPSTLFDLASLTKIFTAHTALQLVESGVGSLDEPIAGVLPSYSTGDRRRVTLRHLLTHTSGLPATWSGWREPLDTALTARPDGALTESPIRAQRPALIEDLLHTPLAAAPGERFEYACTGYNTAMAYFEKITGRPWSTLQRQWTLDPLGLANVTDSPDPVRTAATEYQPALRRGVIRGYVHDETSWALGGGTGNAGLFATPGALLQFGEALRRGGNRVRDELMWDDALSATLGRRSTLQDGGFGSALGLRIMDAAFMGPRATNARGHTGFTGTSLVIDRGSATTIVLLTNRVHPSREGDGLQALRAAITELALEKVGAR